MSQLPRWTKLILLLAPLVLAATGLSVISYTQIGKQSDGSYLIPTGQRIHPTGTHLPVNDRPLGMAMSPGGRILAVVTGSNFNPRALHLIDVMNRAVAQTITLKDSFVGVAFTRSDDTLYVGGNGANEISVFKRNRDGSFAASAADSIAIASSAPSGLALSNDDRTLYVALNLKHTLGIVDLKTRQVTEVPVGSYPYTAVVSPDGSRVYVSNWGGRRPSTNDPTDGVFPVIVDSRTGIASSGTVSVIDPVKRTVLAEIPVGRHPSAMVLNPQGTRLYVANANSDTVSVIDTARNEQIAILPVGIRPGAPLGSSPNALAISADGSTLYVADGSSNAIAVVNPENPRNPVKGLIPTGWYPTAVTVSPAGQQIFVASGYGFGSVDWAPDVKGRSYRDRLGVVSLIDLPDRAQLSRYTTEVRRLNSSLPPGPLAAPVTGSPIPMSVGQPSPIKHVFFIIKENRTYDQVFGDLPKGNGDASLLEFGRDISPNHHALAEQYVLLDNYYGPGDQSALGHRWCTQGYASDWVFKYSNGRNDQNPMLFAPTDFIWDAMKAHGKTVRSFGERGLNTITPSTATWTDIYNDWKNGTSKVTIAPRAQIVGLRDVYSPLVPAAESKVPDQVRADGFLKELAEFEKNGNLPQLNVLLLYNDHTSGTSPGYPTPRASVADNDLALGRVVEAISRSRYWSESAIFVTEDDSQDGVDHVDGHRTVGLVISPYTRRGAVDSTFYTIINMFRTMEQILGLPPMNQFDLAAEPMFSVFGSKADITPYVALTPKVALDEMNPAVSATTGLQRRLALASMKMDFSEPDAAPADLLNRVIWHSVRGYNTPYPKDVRKKQ